MEYKDVGVVADRKMLGKWLKIPVGAERQLLIESMIRINYVRGNAGQSALRHYENGDYIVFTDMTDEVEDFGKKG